MDGSTRARHQVFDIRSPGSAGSHRESRRVSTGTCDPGRCGALVLLRHFQWSLACLLTAATLVPPVASARPAPGPPGPAVDDSPRSSDPRTPPYFVILDAPADFNALLQKLRQPDLEIRPVDRAKPGENGPAPAAPAAESAPWVIESVRIRGRVGNDSATLRVELTIVTSTDEATWVPIRLDDQRLVDAREGPRILDLQMMDGRRWQVGLAGRGRHRVDVELRSPLSTRPARASLSLAIPESPSTSLELDFDDRKPDLIVGTNEVYGQADLPERKGSRLTAQLSPRSRVDVSWAIDEEAGGRNPPLLTAQGDIAIDIDEERMLTRSSWVIRCVRGMTRTLEVRVDDRDEVTEVLLDGQQAGGGIEGGRGEGRLTIPLPEPLRPGAERRLVLMTRRPYTRGAGHRIAFTGFPIVHARQQSGAIGVKQAADLWVAPASAQSLRRVIPTFLPRELAERPGTSLAFEFLDQPFSLVLDVEATPPLIRSRSRTQIRLDDDRARCEATIELQWIRGRPFEVEMSLGPGLKVVSVGPSAVVEAWHPTAETAAGVRAGGGLGPRGLTVRFSPAVRDQSAVTIRLDGFQRLPREGPVKLGLFAPEEATAVSSSVSVAADRGLSVELDQEAARSGRADGFTPAAPDALTGRPASPPGDEPDAPALAFEATGSPRSLPIRIAHHARSLREGTLLSAEVSRRSIEILQRTTLTVSHGALAALEIRVPSALVGGWKLRDREVLDRKDQGRAPDGSRRYRLLLDRPILDRVTVEFQCQLPINPALDASGREVEVPWITFPDAEETPIRIELTPKLGVVFQDGDPAWTRSRASGPAGAGGEAAELAYVGGPAAEGRPFRFRAMGLESMAMPTLLAPRLLIRSSLGFDDTVRYRAWYWLEAHGPSFPFALPDGNRIIAARVGGRAAERVDLEGNRDGQRLYRLRLPAESASRPVLVELEYQLDRAEAGSPWRAPQLLDDGLVLQTLWEVRLPWDRALLGVPNGWSDENEWYWGSNLWMRRPVRDVSAAGQWLLGDAAPTAAAEGLREGGLDESQRLLFGRSAGRPGESTEMTARTVARAWLVAASSGATLLLGFLAIFSRIRFRTAWAIAAVLVLLAVALIQPVAAAQIGQSSLMGVALTLLGVSIQHLLDRRRSRLRPGRDSGSSLGAARSDSSLNRAAAVGSDDSTAIRVRTPSTMDFVPSPLAAQTSAEESRSSTVGRS